MQQLFFGFVCVCVCLKELYEQYRQEKASEVKIYLINKSRKSARNAKEDNLRTLLAEKNDLDWTFRQTKPGRVLLSRYRCTSPEAC